MRSTGAAEFWKQYRVLPPAIKAAARTAYTRFRANPAHPGLSLERLRRDPRAWSVRVTLDYRAVARRSDGDVWVWVWIGPHKEFDRVFRG